MHRVLVCDTSYNKVRSSVNEVFANLRIDLHGKRVLIKSNALSDREPEVGANTHPAVIRALVKKAREAGAAEVVVADNPGQANYGNIAGLFAANGLGEAAGRALRNFGIDLVPRRVPSLEGVDLYFPRLLFEVDYVINVPKLKVHPGTGLTCAVKNCFGYLPGAQKAFCHEAARNRRHFEQVLVDVYNLRRPDLNIVDAVLAGEGRASAGRSLRYFGKLLASRSAPAVDILSAEMLGMEPRQIYHLTYAAAEAGLSLDAGQLSVEGEWERASDVLLSEGFNPGETRSTSPTGPSLRESASSKRFVLDEEACTGCGDCAEQCPTGAVVMEDGRPVQEQERCVACFACMEICQPRAITLEPLCPAD